jgi:hypothetical protein
VADLLPPDDDVVRECLTHITVSQRAIRASRPVDAHRIRDAFRLIDAATPLAAYVSDPALALELQAWRRLRHRR